jgi:hypothetical protein
MVSHRDTRSARAVGRRQYPSEHQHARLRLMGSNPIMEIVNLEELAADKIYEYVFFGCAGQQEHR